MDTDLEKMKGQPVSPTKSVSVSVARTCQCGPHLRFYSRQP
jgi:hypothetical protein